MVEGELGASEDWQSLGDASVRPSTGDDAGLNGAEVASGVGGAGVRGAGSEAGGTGSMLRRSAVPGVVAGPACSRGVLSGTKGRVAGLRMGVTGGRAVEGAARRALCRMCSPLDGVCFTAVSRPVGNDGVSGGPRLRDPDEIGGEQAGAGFVRL